MVQIEDPLQVSRRTPGLLSVLRLVSSILIQRVLLDLIVMEHANAQSSLNFKPGYALLETQKNPIFPQCKPRRESKPTCQTSTQH